MKRILELDGLRAVAILLVLGCHYGGFVSLTEGVSEFGWIGVDIFFVLSGYLITTILLGLRSKAKPYRTFYARRIIRIFPPYIVASLVVFALAILFHEHGVFSKRVLVEQLLFLQAVPGMNSALDVVRHVPWHLSHLDPLLTHAHSLPLSDGRGIHLGLPDVFDTYWSLSIEEYFYVFWAPIVLLLSRRGIVSAAVLISTLEIFMRWSMDNDAAKVNILSRFDALLIGGLLALLLERWRAENTPVWAERLLLSLFVACMLVDLCVVYAIRPSINHEIRESPLVLVVGFPVFFIGIACLIGVVVLRATSMWWLARLLRSKPLQYIGTISYAIYLVHVIAAILVFRLFGLFHRANQMSLFQAVGSTVVSIILARLSWHYIEKPALRWKDRHFPSSPHPAEPVLN